MKDKRGVLRRTYPYFKESMPAICVGLVLLLLFQFISALIPQVPQLIIDRVLNPVMGVDPVYSESNAFTFLLNGYASDDYVGMLTLLIAWAKRTSLYRALRPLERHAPCDVQGRKQAYAVRVWQNAPPKPVGAQRLHEW